MDLKGFEQAGSAWHPKAHAATGAWRIAADDNRLWLKLGADFRTDWGPDVKLYLVTQPVGEIGIRDQLGDSGTLIGPFQAFADAQEYALPAVDRFAGFRAIMLHCQRYSAVWCGIEINLQTP